MGDGSEKHVFGLSSKYIFVALPCSRHTLCVCWCSIYWLFIKLKGKKQRFACFTLHIYHTYTFVAEKKATYNIYNNIEIRWNKQQERMTRRVWIMLRFRYETACVLHIVYAMVVMVAKRNNKCFIIELNGALQCKHHYFWCSKFVFCHNILALLLSLD